MPTQQEEIEDKLIKDFQEWAKKTLAGYGEDEADVWFEDLPAYDSLEWKVRELIRETTTTLAESHKVDLRKLYNYLLSKEAVIAKGGIQTDYENGYFDAIDDLAKHVSQEFNIEV